MRPIISLIRAGRAATSIQRRLAIGERTPHTGSSPYLPHVPCPVNRNNPPGPSRCPRLESTAPARIGFGLQGLAVFASPLS
jgi:hypothetical protein